MADSQDHVSLELIDAGDHKDRVVQVLSKVKGLSMTPEQIVNSAPCTIAANVPRNLAERLQGFLEKAGAMVMLESEEELFTPEDLPRPEEEQQDTAEPSEESPPPAEEEDWQLEAIEGEPLEPSPEDVSAPSEDFDGFSAAVVAAPAEDSEEFEGEEEIEEEKEAGKFQQIVLRLQSLKPKKKDKEATPEEKPEKEKKKFGLPGIPKLRKSKAEEPAEEREEGQPEKESKLSFLSKFRKSKIPSKEPEAEIQEEAETSEIAVEEKSEAKVGKIPGTLLSRLVPFIIGFLSGAVIMGALGWALMRSQQAEYNEKLSDQLKSQGLQLRAELQQREQALEVLQRQSNDLKQQNTELTAQVETLKGELGGARKPRSIEPSAMPGIGALTPAQEMIVREFQDVKEIHAQSLENGYEAQRQASCSQQLLLDGEGTMTYAQVVKKFTAKYTDFNIMKSDSLITPYIAEFKIPFQQQIRTGDIEKACNEGKLEQMPTPVHHEFGSFYGYWIIQYEYKDGKWRVKPTVLEKNRALYESAFKLGSPDYAKFLIDTALFPEFKNQ